MITKAIIKSIDYTQNTCKVSIPIFDDPSSLKSAVFTAVMNVPPGIHSGYVADDVVLVGFVDNSLSKPVVLGKLYLGIEKECISKARDTGYVSCANLEVEDSVVFPSAANIKFKTGSGSEEVSIADLLNRIKALESK
jgi:hypothetical protein